MSGIFTDAFEEATLRHLFTSTSYSRPSNYYIGLLTAVSDKEAGLVTEVSGGGYARAAVSTSGGFAWDSTNKRIYNTSTINFPTPTDNWGAVTHVAIYSTASGGSPLVIIQAVQSKTISAGDTVKIEAGEIQITMD